MFRFTYLELLFFVVATSWLCALNLRGEHDYFTLSEKFGRVYYGWPAWCYWQDVRYPSSLDRNLAPEERSLEWQDSRGWLGWRVALDLLSGAGVLFSGLLVLRLGRKSLRRSPVQEPRSAPATPSEQQKPEAETKTEAGPDGKGGP